MTIRARQSTGNVPRLLQLIHRYPKSGVMIGAMLEPTEEGVPQGDPLAPRCWTTWTASWRGGAIASWEPPCT